MQAKERSSFWTRVIVRCRAVAGGCVLLQPAVSHAAPLGGDTVVYVVKPGDTLRSIAAAHGTTIGAIVRANNMANPDVIFPGQRLVIPVGGGTTPAPGGSTPAPPLCRPRPPVRPPTPVSITPSGWAIRWIRLPAPMAPPPAAIIAANGITNPDLIWVGQKLRIPGASQPGTAAAQPTVKPKPQPAPASPTDSRGAAGRYAGAHRPTLWHNRQRHHGRE